jgi:hypothetical protein
LYYLTVLVWEGGGELEVQEEGAEAAVWSNSSALAIDARRAVRCGARLVRLQWRRVDAGGTASWRDADLTSLHHHREVGTPVHTFFSVKYNKYN